MSLCDACRSPGSCCAGFVLSVDFDVVRWKQEARALMKRYRLPFYPVRSCADTYGPHGYEDSPRTRVQFNCRKLGPDGRCTDYENRPRTCTEYEAGIDSLCAEHVMVFKGIPIHVEHRQ